MVGFDEVFSSFDAAALPSLVLTTFTASRMVGFDEVFSSFDAAALPSLVPLLLLPTATFSFHRKEANNPPMIRKPMDSSKGPVGPRDKAAAPAIWPARMATIESPAEARPNVSPKLLSPPVFPASPTNQASGALNNKLVPIPPNTLPISSTPNRLLLVLLAPKLYNMAKASVPALRP